MKKGNKSVLNLPKIDTTNKVYSDYVVTDKEEVSKSFELQTFGMPEEHVKTMTLNQDDRVWLLRKDDVRDRIIRSDLQQYVDDVYNKTTVLLCSQLGEVLDAHWVRTNEMLDKFKQSIELKMQKIADEIVLIKEDNRTLHDWQVAEAKEIREIKDRLDKKRERIEKLESKVEAGKSRLEALEEVVITIKHLEKAAILVEGFNGRLNKVEKHTNIYWEFIRILLIVSTVGLGIMYGHTIGWW